VVLSVVAVAVVVDLKFDQVFELGLHAPHYSLTLVQSLFTRRSLLRIELLQRKTQKKKNQPSCFGLRLFFILLQINNNS
jgi:hypothetical protein